MDTDDMKIYKALSNGRMGDVEVVTGVVQNVFPHVTSSQRAAGYFDYYKTFWQIADDADGVGIDPEMFHDYPTLSDDDYVLLFEMDQETRVEDITGYATGTDTERKYGVAYLDANITAGDGSFDVVVKNAALATGSDAIFADGDTIRITDKALATSVSGSEETHVLSGAPVVASDGVTITLTIADSGGFANSYTADGSVCRVRSIFEPTSDLETSYSSPVVTSSGGSFDDTTYPIVLDNIGTVYEEWTLYFTDNSGNFRLDGDTLGTGVDTGDTGTEFAPTNSGTGRNRPYFTIDFAAFSGSFLTGDTIVFTTTPAAHGIGQKRVVPAGSASLANNKVSQVLVVESAT